MLIELRPVSRGLAGQATVLQFHFNYFNYLINCLVNKLGVKEDLIKLVTDFYKDTKPN